MSLPYIITVILNTNRRDDTLACLSSLAKNTYEKHSIIVLDNSSTDGSTQAVRSSFPTVQLIELDDNLGYAGNNNVGISAALSQGADWVFVLNEDTILAPDCLEILIDTGQSDPHIGIVGPMVYHHDEPNIIQSAGGNLGRYWEARHIAQNECDMGQFTEPKRADWISGCAIMVRGSVIKQIGGLDDRYFYYWEETDWCLRASKRGWHIVHVPQAKLWHKGVQRDYRPSPSVTYYDTRNRFLFYSKHCAPPYVWALAAWQTLRTLASLTLRLQWQSKKEYRNAMLAGAMDFLRGRWGQRPS